MSSKLRIRIGEVEIDYEGTEEFLKQELPQLLKTAMELHKAAGPSSPASDSKKGKAGVAAAASGVLSLATNSIAVRLGVKSGSDLLKAAAACLALVNKTEPFSRQQLLREMQSATAYYKSTYGSNLTKYLRNAIQKDGPLSQTAQNAYALKAAARADLEKNLADN